MPVDKSGSTSIMVAEYSVRMNLYNLLLARGASSLTILKASDLIPVSSRVAR